MKKIISKQKCNTHMLSIIRKINTNDNWLITDIEAYPVDKKINNLLYKKDYLLLSNNDLIKMLEKEDFQWIWAVFSLIPKKYTKKEILKYNLPSTKNDCMHPLAELEIKCIDSSFHIITIKDEEKYKMKG